MTSAKESMRRLLPAPVFGAASTALDHTLPSRRRNLWWAHQQRVIARLVSEHGPVVQAGPFQGLRLPTSAVWGNLAPLLLGSYECELHPALERLIASAPARVVNVGSAEGYYAVGFARRLPAVEVFAFDIDERARAATRETAAMNGVAGRFHVLGRCSPEELDRILVVGAVAVVDCEGCERELLAPDCVPSLRSATVLVELHDFLDPGISVDVLGRFADSHEIEVVPARERDPSAYPALRRLKAADRAVAVQEYRNLSVNPMQWAVLTPRAAR